MLRVVAGRFGGRLLRGPAHRGLRPTGEMVRKALFDTIGAGVADAVVLDLYAGTGALGIEALSRGAAKVTFVERDARALALIRANLAALGIRPGEAEILGTTVARALERLAAAGKRFDLILADPPYGSGEMDQTLAMLSTGGFLTGKGLLILEHGSAAPPPEPPAGLRLRERRRYGDTTLSFFAVSGQDPGGEP